MRRLRAPQVICRRYISHIEAQEMMDNNMVPPDNHTEKRQYALPESLLASWRQQRRGGAGVSFKDTAIVNLRSGNGGNGKISFLRESGRTVGPPDGGDGGAGGHVFIQASNHVSSLAHMRPTYNAANGRDGGSAQLTGRRGNNVVLHVPVGTVARWAPLHIRRKDFRNKASTEEEIPAETPAEVPMEAPMEASNEASADITTTTTTTVDVVTNWSRFDNDTSIQLTRESFGDGAGWHFRAQEEERWLQNTHFKQIAQRVRQFDMINRRSERSNDMFPLNGIDLSNPEEPPRLLLAGGSGGLGNMHFQTPELRSPTFAKRGRFGCEMTLVLELKMLADLGLVGLPNAGKSTLLGQISRASPEIGDYEFTTLVPSVGVVPLSISGERITVADIPGIVKDAHLNKGLGLGFLRHIERCQGVVLVIGLDRPDVVADAELLISELDERVKGKNVLVVANKADVEGAQEQYSRLADYVKGKGWSIVPCSAREGNVHGVVAAMARAAKPPSAVPAKSAKL